MDLGTLIDMLLLFAFLSVSAVLTAGEFAFFRVRPEWLEGGRGGDGGGVGAGRNGHSRDRDQGGGEKPDRRDRADRRAQVLARLVREPQELLMKLSIGIALSNVLMVLFAVRIAWRSFPGAGRTAATAASLLLVALLVAIFARVLPKIYVGPKPVTAALHLAEPVEVLLLPVSPLAKAVLAFIAELLESKTLRARGDDRVLVGGMARIDDLNEALRTCISKDRGCDTIAGLLYSLAGRVPCEGEEFEAGELRFVVDKVRRRRIERVLIVAEGIGRTAREIEE